jgi:uncharacterized membrane protein YeiH
MDVFLKILDIMGTAAFAVSGAVRGVRHNLDILGVTVLAIATGTFGGIIRDVLIGETRPMAFQNEMYLIICILCAVIVLMKSESIARRSERKWSVVQIFDAIGLGIFAAIGSQKALSAEFGTVGVIMMGMITACGGGVLRDVLVREIPLVLRRDFYATAAMIAVICMLFVRELGFGEHVQVMTTVIIGSGLRFWAMATNMNLPKKIG